jgi:hypothetical protein
VDRALANSESIGETAEGSKPDARGEARLAYKLAYAMRPQRQVSPAH